MLEKTEIDGVYVRYVVQTKRADQLVGGKTLLLQLRDIQLSVSNEHGRSRLEHSFYRDRFRCDKRDCYLKAEKYRYRYQCVEDRHIGVGKRRRCDLGDQKRRYQLGEL